MAPFWISVSALGISSVEPLWNGLMCLNWITWVTWIRTVLFIENLASHVIVLTSYLWKPVTLLKVLQFKYQAIVSDKSFKTGSITTNLPLIGQRRALLYELHNISYHSQPTIIIVHYNYISFDLVNWPAQLSPLNPGGQVHVYPPLFSKHVPPFWHGPEWHFSSSESDWYRKFQLSTSNYTTY